MTSGDDRLSQPLSIGPEPSPLWPRYLADLFIRPRSFFSRRLALAHPANVVLVTWCYGISYQIGRIDTELIRWEIGRPRPGWEILAPFVVESWLGFWLWVLGSGALAGVFLWWLGGWWYRLRLRWSGAADPDKRLARLTFAYSSFVSAGPVVTTAMIQTIVYPNYSAAFGAEEWFSLLLVLFPFWSIATSFAGVTTLFPVIRKKAVVWFVVLPAATYTLVLGLVATLGALVGGGAIQSAPQ